MDDIDVLEPGAGGMDQQQYEQGNDAGAVETYTEIEEEESDTTAEQYRDGKDIQGIPWERLNFSREHYRDTRLKQYRNYTNVIPDSENLKALLLKECKHSKPDGCFYEFARNSRAVQSNIVHFQLRNLVSALSRNDVYVVHENCVNHWNPVAKQTTKVLNLAGPPRGERVPGIGRVQVSTMSVNHDIVAAGGFSGELVVKRLDSQPGEYMFSGRVTQSENGITNGIEIFNSVQYGTCIMTSNNDAIVRVFDGETFKLRSRFHYPWAVNYSTLRPQSHLVAVVGDDPVTYLSDLHNGITVAQLHGHKDFSFAAAWHPNGNLLATGNQDTTTIIWDLRYPVAPLVTLPGRMGAVRSVRFSADGRFLAMAEPADFVHIYDVKANFDQYQEVDLFGEIAGVSFTPESDCFFIGIADITYSSLLQFDRYHPATLW